MSFKYALITIIKNLKKEYMDHYLGRLLGQEIKVTDEDNIIIEFEDGTLIDTLDYNEDDLISDDGSYYSEDSVTDNMDTKVDSKYDDEYCEDATTEIDSYNNEYESETYEKNSKNRIILGIKHYSPLCLNHFMVNNILFQYKIPIDYTLFKTTATISYKNLFSNKFSDSKIKPKQSYIVKPSIYNMIYHRPVFTPYYDTIDSFGIAKIESSDLKPRFVVVYEDKYFKKQDIIYLIDILFKYKF